LIIGSPKIYGRPSRHLEVRRALPDIDYDALRKTSMHLAEESLDDLTERHRKASPNLDLGREVLIEPDDFQAVDSYLDEGELTVTVLPMQANEFRCSRCFLVRNRSRLAAGSGVHSRCHDYV